MRSFNKDNLPSDDVGWSFFTKRSKTKMLKIQGPFEVETKEGVLSCTDGWLALDASGNPYPIDDSEQKKLYRE